MRHIAGDSPDYGDIRYVRMSFPYADWVRQFVVAMVERMLFEEDWEYPGTADEDEVRNVIHAMVESLEYDPTP